jgi:hypothetical protein
MKERNKSIFRIMLFASAGILLAQTVLLAVLGNDRQMRIVLPLVFFFVELATCALMVFCTLNPQHNYNYTVKRVDGRWRWERIKYGPDPEGLRYVSAGVCVLMLALLFAVISAAVLWPNSVAERMVVVAGVVLLTVFCITYCIIESKLRKKL